MVYENKDIYTFFHLLIKIQQKCIELYDCRYKQFNKRSWPTNLLMKYSKRKKGSNSFKNSKMIYDSPYTKM